MPRNLTSSAFMKPFVILALPGMYLFYKYNQYKQQQQEQSRRKVTERELAQLNHKIDKLLTKLEENEPELATSQEDECVICCNAKATMQTSPCGHRVVCRKCFVKTIQMAVSQRLLPLRCVICRAKILRLKQSSGHGLTYSKSWLMPSSASSYSMSAKSWSAGTSKHYWNEKNWVPSSASQYSMSSRNVPSSASMYSMTSGSSSLSGMSSVSSATNSSVGSKSSSTAAGRYQQPPRQPNGSLRKSQQYSMKMRIQEYNESRVGEEAEKPPRLSPIVEFQREYRMGKERATSSSTRIRCAQKIVTQLETGPGPSDKNWKKTTPSTISSSSSSASTSFFKSSLRPSGKEDKKRDKSEDKRKGKSKSEGKTPTTDSTEAKENKDKKTDKKETKGDKKKNKKETEKRDEANANAKNDKKESKTGKNETEMKSKETIEKKDKSEKEKETLL